MKRIELFKKTGICFTAFALSAALSMASPMTMTAVFAGETTEAAKEEENNNTQEEKEKENEEPKPDNNQESDTGHSQESDTGHSQESDTGHSQGSDTGHSQESDTGHSQESDTGHSQESDTGHSQESDTGHSQESDTGNSQESPENSTQAGSDSVDKGDTTDGSPSTGKTNGSTGNTGNAGNAGQGQSQTGNSAQQTTTPAATPNAATQNVDKPLDDVPTVTLPKNNKNAKDNTKPLKERQTTLNPGEVPTGFNETLNHNGTNEQLIASQNIVSGLSIIRDDFRFYTVDKNLAFSSKAQAIHEEMKNSSRQIGIFSENDALYVLSEEKDGWVYVESGNVRGFVKLKDILVDDKAEAVLEDLQAKLDALAEISGEKVDAETMLTYAEETVPANENSAFTYKRCTTKSTVIDKKYAVAENDTGIRESTSDEAREIGHLAPGGLAYIIMQTDDQWVYVESGNVRGFVRKSDLTTGDAAKKIVQESGEASMETAEELVAPGENEALYYTLNSVRDGVAYNSIRTDMIQAAAQCLGNPYVWGGTSLTHGADCSGFVQTLYSMFGYKIPRVADAQSRYGTQIPISDAAPGDLIFFASNGYVYHVALYAGDGMTIEAYSEDRGIIATPIGNRDAVWATRVIED